MDILEKIQKEIEQQTRNGRKMIYIETTDLEKLGMTKFHKNSRVFINIKNLNMLIETYKEHQKEDMER